MMTVRMMMRKLVVVASGLLVSLVIASAVEAATDNANLNVNATVNSRAKLTLGTGTINFADADPDTTPSIPATENAVNVSAQSRTGSSSTVTLTVLAGGDLISGGDTIGINNVTWTVSGAGYVAGTMNKTVAQSAGSWTGPGTQNGTFSFFLANSWSYAPGSYAASATYTLTAP
jgi:hypothetical protein